MVMSRPIWWDGQPQSTPGSLPARGPCPTPGDVQIHDTPGGISYLEFNPAPARKFRGGEQGPARPDAPTWLAHTANRARTFPPERREHEPRRLRPHGRPRSIDHGCLRPRLQAPGVPVLGALPRLDDLAVLGHLLRRSRIQLPVVVRREMFLPGTAHRYASNAPMATNDSLSWSLPREIRDFTVPLDTPRAPAMSS